MGNFVIKLTNGDVFRATSGLPGVWGFALRLGMADMTSPREIAQDVLTRCVDGNPPAELPQNLLEDPDGQALFGTLIEGLADRFEPALCDLYVRLMAKPVADAVGGVDAGALVERYQRVRQVRPVASEPEQVYVLSRVTLGADVAITSVLLDAVRRRFRRARIALVGPRKNFELFAGDPRVRHVPLNYRRGSLRERLAVYSELKELMAAPGSILIDPDSRLTQLGLLPVCPEERYYFFESRAYGGDSHRTLMELAASWAGETLGVNGARPLLALNTQALPISPSLPYITASFGVGENPAKRMADPFEEQLLALLARCGLPLFVDRGAGGEEAERVRRAAERSGAQLRFWDGSFAGFAGLIAGARLYVGYDSAGQHAAAACGIPLVSIFTGFPVPRMLERWKPAGDLSRVIRVDSPNPDVAEVLSLVQAAIQGLGLMVS